MYHCGVSCIRTIVVDVGRFWLVSGERVAREGPGVTEHTGLLLLDEARPTDSTCGEK